MERCALCFFSSSSSVPHPQLLQVSLVRHASVKTDLALKVLERNHSPVVQEQYDNEKLFASFSEVGKSPQLIRLLASWETDDHFYLVRYSVYFGDVRVYSLFYEKKQLMDFCPGGDLYQLVNDYHISEENATWIIAQAASAIETVHSLDFAHRYALKNDEFCMHGTKINKIKKRHQTRQLFGRREGPDQAV